MAFSVLVTASKSAAGSGGATTDAVDTTGANLIVIAVSRFNGAITLSDSKGNTWTPLTDTSSSGCRLYYTVPSSVGSGHTFSTAGTNVYAPLAVLAVSGAAASPFDAQNTFATGSGSTGQPGSITPAEDNELLVACAYQDNGAGPSTIDSGYTEVADLVFIASNSLGLIFGYKIQTAAGAENPTFTYTATNPRRLAAAAFKAAAGGGGGNPWSVYAQQ